jgi:hypothetical protein
MSNARIETLRQMVLSALAEANAATTKPEADLWTRHALAAGAQLKAARAA